jgi:hypothetical protein
MFPLSHCPHCKSRSNNIKVEAVYIGKDLLVANCIVCGWHEYGQTKLDKKPS